MANRRGFLQQCGVGLGAIALSQLGGNLAMADSAPSLNPMAPKQPHFPGKVKRVIYLFMAGAPCQMDLFDYKPKMADLFDVELPDSVRMGQRLTTMTSGQKRFPVAPSKYKFQQYGQSGAWVSELLPNTAKMVDDIAALYEALLADVPHSDK